MVQVRIDPIDYDLGRVIAYRAMLLWTDTDAQPGSCSFNIYGESQPTKEKAVASLKDNIRSFQKGLKEIGDYFTNLNN